MDSDKLQQEALVLMIARQYIQLGFAGIVNMCAGAIICWVLIKDPGINKNTLSLWYFILVSTNLINIIIVFAFKHYQPSAKNIRAWVYLYRSLIFILCCAWGSMNFILHPHGPVGVFYLLFSTFAVSAGFALGTATDIISTVISLSCLLGSLVAWNAGLGFYHFITAQPNVVLHFQLALGYFLYTAFAFSASRNFYKLENDLALTNTKNIFLNDKLSEQNLLLENMNNVLESRVQQRTAELEHMAYHDWLTGMPNLRKFELFVQKAIAMSTADSSILIFQLGIDNFKNINASLTHDVGNQLLVAIAKRLTEHLPKIVGLYSAEHQIARMMGDNFAVAMQFSSTEGLEVKLLAKEILAIVHEPFVLQTSDNNKFKITMSMGVSEYPKHGKDPKELIMNAETAMHYAKSQGKNKFLLYSCDMNANTLAKLNLVYDLRHAIKNNELLLYYQPLVSLKNGTIIGFEALIRWQHPQRGLLSPIHFISLAEEDHELIAAIDSWVLATAVSQLKSWHDLGHKGLKVSVNLSFKQLNDDEEFADRLISNVQQLILQTNMPPECLTIELTESVACKQPEKALAVMERLKQVKIKLAIDDFGTGYSSLSYLAKFPIDIVKIDKSFTTEMIQSKDALNIITTIIDMAHKLNLIVLAEGVETIEQLTVLQQLQCDLIQGYYFSPPVPETKANLFLSSKKCLGFASSVENYRGKRE